MTLHNSQFGKRSMCYSMWLIRLYMLYKHFVLCKTSLSACMANTLRFTLILQRLHIIPTEFRPMTPTNVDHLLMLLAITSTIGCHAFLEGNADRTPPSNCKVSAIVSNASTSPNVRVFAVGRRWKQEQNFTMAVRSSIMAIVCFKHEDCYSQKRTRVNPHMRRYEGS